MTAAEILAEAIVRNETHGAVPKSGRLITVAYHAGDFETILDAMHVMGFIIDVAVELQDE